MKKIAFLFLILSSVQVFSADKEHQHHASHHEKSVLVSEGSIYNVTTPWVDMDGKKQQLSSLKGKIQVVAMVYTSCQYACPLITADIKKIETLLSGSQKSQVGFVLFSFDPTRDTPKALNAYAKTKSLGNSWNLFTSTENGVRELAAVLGIKYKKDKKGDFDHSNIIFVLDKQGVVAHQQVGLNQDPQETFKIIKDLTK